MAKNKGAAGGTVTNRPAYSRVSFLYQAAALLAGTPAAPSAQEQRKPTVGEDADGRDGDATTIGHDKTAAAAASRASPPLQGMARRLLTQMRAVSRKTNMRVRPALKHRVCKYCDTLLVEGTTCVSTVENHSRGGRKPWADVLVVTCKTCARARRYPVSAPRQPRRPFRDDAEKAGEGVDDGQSPNKDEDAQQEKQSEKTRSKEKTKKNKTGTTKQGPG